MQITYSRKGINNFHNARSITLRVSGEQCEGISGMVYRISRHQAARIRGHFCGITDCHCSAGSVEELNYDGTEFGIPVASCD